MKKLTLCMVLALVVGCGEDEEPKREPLDSRLSGEILSMACDGLTSVYQVRLDGKATVLCAGSPADAECSGFTEDLDGAWQGEVRCKSTSGIVDFIRCSDARAVYPGDTFRARVSLSASSPAKVPGYRSQCPSPPEVPEP